MSDPVLIALITGGFSLAGIYLTARMGKQNRADRDLADQLVASQERIITLQAAEIRRLGGTPPIPGTPEATP